MEQRNARDVRGLWNLSVHFQASLGRLGKSEEGVDGGVRDLMSSPVKERVVKEFVHRAYYVLKSLRVVLKVPLEIWVVLDQMIQQQHELREFLRVGSEKGLPGGNPLEVNHEVLVELVENPLRIFCYSIFCHRLFYF